jgi:UDP-N-acetylglucosamine 2-epimerase (non-hydrolysing)
MEVANRATGQNKRILNLFGTRPEVIKLAPVIRQLDVRKDQFETINVTSGQHKELLYPFIRQFGLRIDYDLQIMQPKQTPNDICSRVLSALDPILADEKPDLILVQGDTTTAMAGALAGFHRRIPVGHVEAGLRSGNNLNPYPEEMNRRVISRLATCHFAATSRNCENLLAEGVCRDKIFLTGNPVVDSLQAMLRQPFESCLVKGLMKTTQGLKTVVLTTHRRESFGQTMAENLRVLRSFVERRRDVALIFPVHPNPNVTELAHSILGGHGRIHLIAPLDYEDFIRLLCMAWLIVSDSGGVQEEAPTLGKPLLILRENTERPETIECGVARLVGGSPKRLELLLEWAYLNSSLVDGVARLENPFGTGDSGLRIANAISGFFGLSPAQACCA